jgi:hypothetical protein
MRTFIQLRDGIGYATIVTPTGEPDHTVTPDHTTAIEVFTENPDEFLNKKYDPETKSWSNAPIIRWAEVNENGVPVEIHRTVFAHQVSDTSLIMPDEANGLWKLIDGEWLAPVIYVPSEQVEPEPQTMIESANAEAEGEQN